MAVVDGLGNPLARSLTAGQASSITDAEPLLEGLGPEIVITGKGYGSDALVETLKEREFMPVVPP